MTPELRKAIESLATPDHPGRRQKDPPSIEDILTKGGMNQSQATIVATSVRAHLLSLFTGTLAGSPVPIIVQTVATALLEAADNAERGEHD